MHLYAGRCSSLKLGLVVVHTQPGQECSDAEGHLYVGIAKQTGSRPLHVHDPSWSVSMAEMMAYGQSSSNISVMLPAAGSEGKHHEVSEK